jgi:hypothetical protein
MRSIVIGAGAVGNATAFYLHKRGHEVVVIERQPGAALETSLGNGGVVHASEVEPWSQPGMPRKILSWLGQENAPLLLRYGAIPHMWRWGLDFVANCTPARFRANAVANLRIALLSLQSLQEIRAETAVQYDCGTNGVLKIYRDPRSLDGADAGLFYYAAENLQTGPRVVLAACDRERSDSAHIVRTTIIGRNDHIGIGRPGVTPNVVRPVEMIERRNCRNHPIPKRVQPGKVHKVVAFILNTLSILSIGFHSDTPSVLSISLSLRFWNLTVIVIGLLLLGALLLLFVIH